MAQLFQLCELDIICTSSWEKWVLLEIIKVYQVIQLVMEEPRFKSASCWLQSQDFKSWTSPADFQRWGWMD